MLSKDRGAKLGHVRIGEVVSRTGIAAATVRVWERRYGLVQPGRTAGGQRDYSEEDVARIRAVAALVDSGIRVSEAVRRLATLRIDPDTIAEPVRARLWEAADALDERATRAALVEALEAFGVADALDSVVVPVLRRLGDEWRITPRNIAREHFASTVIRSHLVELLPSAITAQPDMLAFCPPGEQHDIGLVMAALSLAASGRQPVLLGAHTPINSVDILVRELRPSIVLIAAMTRRPVARLLQTWRRPKQAVVIAGGAGFREDDAARLHGIVHAGPYRTLPSAVAAALDKRRS